MKGANRDLLVLLKDDQMSQQALEQEVELLHEMLYRVESLQQFCVAHEIIDMNRYKILRKPHLIQQVVRQHELKPFQFVFNKN
jgi:hypothetical protein